MFNFVVVHNRKICTASRKLTNLTYLGLPGDMKLITRSEIFLLWSPSSGIFHEEIQVSEDRIDGMFSFFF